MQTPSSASASADALAALRAALPVRADGVRFFARKRPRGTPKTAIAVLSHAHGRYLAEAVESALAQSWPPREVVVIDIASTDETAAVAASFADRGVRVVRINGRHPNDAKRAALAATTAEALVFLDGDDVLPPDYLERGLPLLAEHGVGLVYTDIQEFGAADARLTFPRTEPGRIDRANYIHAGAIVTRHALEISQALGGPDGEPSHHDWRTWRRVLGAGFRAVKSPALYRQRRHDGQLSRMTAGLSYYDKAGLAHEPVTIFIPLSGRTAAWESHLRPWLDGQAWPRAQCRLVLADTSQDPAFGAMVRDWLHASGYAPNDARYYTQVVGQRGLNAMPRPNDGGHEVNLALRRIYARMACELTTDVVLVIEDDHRPPDDAIERLLRGLDPNTAAVSGLYRGRDPGGLYVCWSRHDPLAIRPAEGPAIPISGSGFGTLLLRRSWLEGETFAPHLREPFPYDIGYSHRVVQRGGTWKLARDVLSEHHGAPPLPAAESMIDAAIGDWWRESERLWKGECAPCGQTAAATPAVLPEPETAPAPAPTLPTGAQSLAAARPRPLATATGLARGTGDRRPRRAVTVPEGHESPRWLRRLGVQVDPVPEPVPAPQPSRRPATARDPNARVRAGIIAPGIWSGGAEQWMHSLVRHTDPRRIDWVGVAVVYEQWAGGAMREVIARELPVLPGFAAAERLYQECDVVLLWGIATADQRIPPPPRACKVALVSHGCGHWTARVFEQPERADAWIGVSPSSISPMPPEWRDRTRVILNCYEPERVRAVADREQLRQRWGVRPGEHVVGYLGRVSAEKNPEALIELVAARPDVRGVVVSGSDPDKQEALRVKAKQAGVADRIIFHGYAPTAGHALPGFDWLLLPSHEEACAITLLEAWAAGVPAIATPVGVVTEHPELVRMVPIKPTGQSLAAALDRDLAGLPAVAARVAAARTVAETVYGPVRFGREWTDLICSLARVEACST